MKLQLPHLLRRWVLQTVLVAACTVGTAQAANVYWQGGDGLWNSDNWATAAPPQDTKIGFTNGDQAIFSGTAANGTISIGAGQTVAASNWLKFTGGFVGGLSLASDAVLNLSSGGGNTGDIIMESANTTVTLSGGTINSNATITFFAGNNQTLTIAENTIINLDKEVRPGGTSHIVNINGTVNSCLTDAENRFNNGGGTINVGATGIWNIGTATHNATLTMGSNSILNINGTFNCAIIAANSGSTITTTGHMTATDYRGTGSTLNVNSGSVVTLTSLNLCVGSATNTTVNFNGGTMIITGTQNSGTPIGGDSLLLANYPAQGTINMTSGTLSAVGAKLGIRDGSAVVNLSGDAVMNILGIKLRTDNSLTLNLGYSADDETVTGGRLNLGASGAESGYVGNLGTGTIGALGNYSNTSAMILHSSTGTTFDTTKQSVGADGIASATSEGAQMTFNGVLSGTGKIIAEGLGTLILNGANTFEGGVDIKSGTVQIGNAAGLGTGTASLSSTSSILNLNGQAATNKIEITNGELQNSGAYRGEVVINQSGSGVTVGELKLGGLSDCTMNVTSGINGDTVTTLTGIAGNVTLTGNNTIGISSGMSSDTQGGVTGANAAVDNGSSNLTLGAGSTLTLSLTDALAESLLNNTTLDKVYLNVATGTLAGSISQISLDSTYSAFKYIFQVKGIVGGQVELTQDTSNTLIVPTGKDLTISSANEPGIANKDHIINNGTINVTAPGGSNIVLNGFEGGTSGKLNTGTHTDSTITLAQGGLSDDDIATYNGTIEGSAGIDKTGKFTQVLGGKVTASSLTVSDGKLSFVSPSGTSTISGNIDVKNGATLGVSGNGTTLNGESLTSNAGSLIDIGQGSTLNIAGTAATTLGGDVTGGGTLSVHGALNLGAGNFVPSGAQTYNSTIVKLNDGSSFNVSKNSQVGALSGTGTLNLGANTLGLGGNSGVFEGTINGNTGSKLTMDASDSAKQVLYGAGNANTALGVSKGTLVLQNKGDTSASYGNTTVGSGATLQIGGYPGTDTSLNPHSTKVHLSSLSLASGSTLNLYMGNDAGGNPLSPALTTNQAVTIGSGVTVKVNSYINENFIPLKGTSDINYTLIQGETGTASVAADSANPKMGFLSAFYNWTLKAEGSDIILSGTTRAGNFYEQAGLTANSTAVANLLYQASDAIASSPGTLLRDLADCVANNITDGNLAKASHVMSAAGGSTVTSLIMAQNNQLNDEMDVIRNRTITMGASSNYVNQDAPYYHCWVQGRGGYNDLNASGDESGYKLSTWGATVGMDIDFNETWTAGVAFSSLFGNLDAHAADTASGDLDSYYLSLFAKYQRKAWSHTLVLMGAWNEMKLNRSVTYCEGSYGAQGKTNGGGFGALYELTYDIPMNEEATSIWQPLFNIAFATSGVKGYDETGAENAGLKVNKMDMTTTTLGLGGRWLGTFGRNLFGRESFAQFRANVSQELGDNRGKANVAFLGNPGYSQQIVGVKAGTTAIQVGAAVSTPINQNSSVFIEANADFRSKQNSVNGSIGYRYDF